MKNSGTLKVTAHSDREIVLPEWLMNTGPFDDPWRQGEPQGTAVVVEQGGKTTLTITLLHESSGTCDTVLKSPVEHGSAASYDRPAELLARPAELLARPAELLAMTLALGDAQAGL